nr:NUDIX domain-containing protein [Paenibacillus pasadenensis]
MFDIYNEHWELIGVAARKEVHRLGLRHRTFHCWLITDRAGQPCVRFQKRQLGKDTYPGYLDITAAGHLTAGEGIRDAMREIEEELGVAAVFEELVPIGSHEERAVGTAGGIDFIDHERSDEFALRCNLPLLEHRLQRDEVAGIYEASLDDLIRLFEGITEKIEAEGAEWAAADGESGGVQLEHQAASGLTSVRLQVRAEDFVPRQNGYYADLFRRLRKLAGMGADQLQD